VRLTTRCCGDKAPVKEKGCLQFVVLARSFPRKQMIRTVVLLDSLLLSSWFSSGIGAEGRTGWQLGLSSGRGYLAILV
jgi:hypothetical protein